MYLALDIFPRMIPSLNLTTVDGLANITFAILFIFFSDNILFGPSVHLYLLITFKNSCLSEKSVGSIFLMANRLRRVSKSLCIDLVNLPSLVSAIA